MWNGKVSLSILIFCECYYIVVLNLNVTGGSALSCSSLTQALFTLRLFPSTRMLSLLPTGLPTPQPNTPTFQPCIFLLNLIIISLHMPYTGKLRIVWVATWKLVPCCMNLCACQIEKSRPAANISYQQRRDSPNSAQYWCFFFFLSVSRFPCLPV